MIVKFSIPFKVRIDSICVYRGGLIFFFLDLSSEHVLQRNY